MTHKQAREAILRIIKAPINKNEHEGLYVTTSDICINKLVSTKLGEVAYEIDKILEKYTESKKPSNVYAISGNKLTPLRESNELKVFDIDGQVYSVLIGDIDQYTEQKILEARISELKYFKHKALFRTGTDQRQARNVERNFNERIAELESQLAKIKEGKS